MFILSLHDNFFLNSTIFKLFIDMVIFKYLKFFFSINVDKKIICWVKVLGNFYIIIITI